MDYKFHFTFALMVLVLLSCQKKKAPPNILFCLSDDQSWAHTSFAGAAQLHTPGFDRVAANGIYFENAYTAAPSCAPSRAAILTGQEIYRLKEGGLLFGALPDEFPVFPQILKKAGYQIGYTGKGYAPARFDLEGYWQDPLKQNYDSIKLDPPPGIYQVDYAANFRTFLEKNRGEPFFFWYGAIEPHREYAEGIGKEHGKSLDHVNVPGFLPDSPQTRKDVADYYFEIEWFDQHLQQMLNMLEEFGYLENTMVVVASDNGMPFPRAKATLYDYGTHMPLAISWPAQTPKGRQVKDFVSFTDFAPTFLELAGLDVPEQMTGRSFSNILFTDKEGQVDPDRNQVITAIERHTYARRGGLPYPSRAIRQGDWVYIRNFEPNRWPAGGPDFKSPHQGIYGDIDRGLSRSYLLENKEKEQVKPYFQLAFGKRPADELYNLKDDPFQLNNLAEGPNHQEQLDQLKSALMIYLEKTNDPRTAGDAPWDDYPYYFQDFPSRFDLPVAERDSLIDGYWQ
ncbi:MAG: sulfatase family protein [Candidatus Cyclobacteriaceae bacterium M3_2C_046]